MRSSLQLLATLVPLALPMAAFAAPVLGDASFEAVTTGAGGLVYKPTDAGGFTFIGYSGVASNGSAFVFANAPDGTKVGFIQTYLGSPGGGIGQTITGLTVGSSYSVSFQAAARPNYGGDGFNVAVSTSAASTTIGTFAPTSTSFQPFTTANFVASATSETLIFLGLAGSATQDLSTALDLITINALSPAAVPEPASLALLGAGLLGVLGLRRRSRDASAA